MNMYVGLIACSKVRDAPLDFRFRIDDDDVRANDADLLIRLDIINAELLPPLHDADFDLQP